LDVIPLSTWDATNHFKKLVNNRLRRGREAVCRGCR
jgi:hypothetical protein